MHNCRSRHLAVWFTALLGALTFFSAPIIASAQVTAEDVDAQRQPIPRPGRLTIVMYTNADLETESKALSKTLDPYRGAKDFMFLQVVDLRGSIAPIARRMVEKQIRSELDTEATRVKPFYVKNGSSANPRANLATMVDYGGSTLSALGWSDRVEKVRFIVYGPNGNIIRRIDDTGDIKAVAAQFRALLGK